MTIDLRKIDTLIINKYDFKENGSRTIELNFYGGKTSSSTFESVSEYQLWRTKTINQKQLNRILKNDNKFVKTYIVSSELFVCIFKNVEECAKYLENVAPRFKEKYLSHWYE